jgi:hypothetical protein
MFTVDAPAELVKYASDAGTLFLRRRVIARAGSLFTNRQLISVNCTGRADMTSKTSVQLKTSA